MRCTYLTLTPGYTDDPIYLSAPPPAVMEQCPLDALPKSDRCAVHTLVPPMTLADAYEELVSEIQYEPGEPTTL